MMYEEDFDNLIAYVEGQLPSSQREAFERRLAESAEVRAALEEMRAIDTSAQRTFAVPQIVRVDVNERIGNGSENGAIHPPLRLSEPMTPANVTRPAASRRWMILVGAAIAASILVALSTMFFAQSERQTYVQSALTVRSLYDAHVAGGFVPDWVCKDDADFIDTTKKAFGVPLLARSEGDVQIIGWTGYGDQLTDLGVSHDAKAILAKVCDEPVIVLIDRAGSTQRSLPDQSADKKLNIFRREIAGLTLYEITPRPKPAAIETFVLR